MSTVVLSPISPTTAIHGHTSSVFEARVKTAQVSCPTRFHGDSLGMTAQMSKKLLSRRDWRTIELGSWTMSGGSHHCPGGEIICRGIYRRQYILRSDIPQSTMTYGAGIWSRIRVGRLYFTGKGCDTNCEITSTAGELTGCFVVESSS